VIDARSTSLTYPRLGRPGVAENNTVQLLSELDAIDNDDAPHEP